MADDLERLKRALAPRYTVQREVGRGGMATVCLAHDGKHDRAVALKILKPELAAALGPERFLREIALTARLDHPHILPLLDSGEVEGFLYYVMPYVEGESLRDRLNREKQLPLEDAFQIAREVADALSYAHSLGIVHRDIKPENILLAAGHARLADFGIARALTAAGGESLTETGLAIGTPAYMSPEQAGGERDVDARTDVYSLGCVAYEMLAGQPPYTGATREAILARKSLEAVSSLRVVRESVPGAVEAAIAKALAKTPADRFTTAWQFAEALRGALEAPVGVTPAAATRTPRRASRAGRLTAVAAAVVVVGIAGLWALRSRDTAETPREIPRLVVLPFENLGVPEHEYFVQGMTDEVTARLAGLTGLAVIARQSAMLYKGSGKTPQQIAADLDADYLLEATVSWQRSPQGPSRVRIRPQLIRARDASHVWADVFDEDLTEVFAVQTSIASRVVRSLDVALLDRERRSLAKVPTANAQAHDYFLRASFLFAQRDRQMLNRALEGLRRALELDPAFSPARARIAMVYAQMLDYGWVPPDVPPESLLAAGLATADSLIAQDHESPDAWVARGYLLERFGDHRLTEARAAFETAISLDPRHVEAHNRLGWVFLGLGRDSAALAQARATLNLDPMWHVPYYLLGRVSLLNGELSQAETMLDSVVFLAPSHAGGRAYRARVRLLIGDTAGARADAALAGAHSTLTHALIDAATGRRLPALTAVEHVLKNDPRADLLDAAMVYTALGSHENARDLLERAWDSPHFWRQLQAPGFVGLREHPWFHTLFIRARQRATGS